jgi:hypothetical protein
MNHIKLWRFLRKAIRWYWWAVRTPLTEEEEVDRQTFQF